MKRNLLLLALCQGLFLTNNVSFIAINGLVGLSLAPYSWLATLPVMSYVLGSAVFAAPVSRLHRRLGHRKSFITGALVAVGSALLCMFAAINKNFPFLVLGTFLAGFYQANGQLYRFAAAELATDNLREKAVSWVLAGGLIGAIIGPNIATATKNMFEVDFAGSYFALACVGIGAIFLLSMIRFQENLSEDTSTSVQVPTSVLIRRPVFVLATLAAALSYGVMNLLMAATPLAMNMCSYPFSKTALVLEWHVIGMFAPGFFTGHLIKRYGSIPIMSVGVALYLVCIAVALSGDGLTEFLIALFTLGIGWNFLFTASTTLALTSYSQSERDKAQAIINTAIFSVMAVSAFSSGALVTEAGWALLNLGSIVPTLVIAGSIGLFVFYRKQQQR